VNDTEIRDLLARVADEVPASTPVDPGPALRRGYRRIRRTAAAGALGIAFAIALVIGGAGLLRTTGPTNVPADPGPTTAPHPSGGMWPQESLAEVRRAQRLADAGDTRYTWQVVGQGPLTEGRPMEFVTRFLREVLGWEEFNVSEFPGLYAGVSQDGLWELLAVRCAPGRTNPLYPNDPEGSTCAPTIDERRYETVLIGAEPPVRSADDPSAIWVVTRWEMLEPVDVRVTGTNYMDDDGEGFRRQVRQVVPASDADANALVEAFLEARVDGEDVGRYLSSGTPETAVPLLYATTSEERYERTEFELVDGPVWPGGWREYAVRLFAADGSVVEQSFLVEHDEDGSLVLVYASLDPFDDVLTTENGGALPDAYEFLDGEVTFSAALPWDYSLIGDTDTMHTLNFQDPDQDAGFDQRLAIVADPRPVETGCDQGPAPADADELARTMRSDADLEATAPVVVNVGGIEGLQMDVVVASGASVCDDWGAPQVLTPNDRNDWPGVALRPGERMRVFLLDLPEGLSARTLAIAISAPQPDFERVLDAATPILQSFEFHPR